MKLKIYDSSLSGGSSVTKLPCMNVCPGNGTITLNSAARTLTGYKHGDTVALFNDEESPEDWYIGKDQNGFVLKAKDEQLDSSMLQFRCTALTQTLVESLKLPAANSYSILMAGQPTKIAKNVYWGILTGTAKAVNRKKPEKK
jgi:hypothetical protein